MDNLSQAEILETKINTSITDPFKQATRALKLELKQNFEGRAELGLDDILDRVYLWENENQEKVSPDEIGALQALSLMLGTVKFQMEHGDTPGERTKANLQNIETEHEILRIVFSNLTPEGEPNEVIMRSFGLITCVFEEYFANHSLKLKDFGVDRRSGLWQGAMGMSTVAMMFYKEGWEVRLPPAELDYKYEADLIVKDKMGRIFTVDVSERFPELSKEEGDFVETFYVKKTFPNEQLRSKISNLSGTLRINIPPIWKYESERFYKNKATGAPSEWAMDKFRDAVKP